MFDFGMRLKELQERKGLTQVQVANKLNLHKSTISGYEGNTKIPSISTITQLAIFYNTSADYILGIENRKMICVEELTDKQLEIIELQLVEFKSSNKKGCC